MKDLSGQHLGRYHIIEPLGQGGMATVFKGYDTSLERFVAIKVIRPDLESGENQGEFLKRFQREARALAKLDHPYILKVLDYGEQEGIPYLVMPFVPGGTLKEKMGKALTSAQAASLVAPIARALEYAHSQNIIHRDVKPANILISESGAPLLSDFGIAKILATETTGQLTATGVGIGTPDYMAPEQWMGVADPGTDVYSLGVVFYEMVTGHRPFSADTPAAVLIKHLRDPLPRPKSYVADLSDDVENVLYKALAKEPSNRFKSMGSFAEALEKLARNEATHIAAMDVDIPTMQTAGATVLSAQQTLLAGPSATRLTPNTIGSAAAARPGPINMGLALVIGVVVIGLVCLLGGGALLAARSFLSQTKAQPSQAVTSAPGATAPAAQTTAPGQPTQTAAPENTPTQAAPIQTIDGLPEDIPLLTENNGDLITTKNTGVTMFTLSSDLPKDKIQEFYTSGMKEFGWELVNESTQQSAQGSMYSWYFSKGETRMAIIMLAEASNGMQITIMLPEQ